MGRIFRQISEAKDAAAVGMVLAAAVCIGFALDRWGGDVGSPLRIACLIGGFVVLSAVAFAVVRAAYAALDGYSPQSREDRGNRGVWSVLAGAKGWCSWWKLFLIVCVCWLPYILVCNPGSTTFDYVYQLSMWLGAAPPNDHHPYLTTVFFGTCFQLGSLLGGNQAGILVTMLVQSALFAAVLAYGVVWLDRLGASRGLVGFALALVALCPLFGGYAQWCVKNTLACASFFLFVLQVFIVGFRHSSTGGGEDDRSAGGEDDRSASRGGGQSTNSAFTSAPVMTLVAVSCCLTRHDGLVVVAITLIVFIVAHRKDARLRRMLGVVLAATVGLYAGWHYVLLPAAGVSGGSSSAIHSVAYQQVAGTVQARPDDFAAGEDREQVEELLQPGVSVEDLAEKYTPEIVDPVRGLFRDDDGALLRECARLAVRYPLTNARVFLRDTLGYWYPFRDPDAYVESNPTMFFTDEIELGQFEYELEDVHVAHPFAKEALSKAVGAYERVPVLGLLSVPAFYAWACLVLGVYVLTRRKPGRIVVVPSAALFAICCASPLNGSVRYALPLLLFALLLAASAFAPAEKKKPKSKPKHASS